MRTLIFEYNYGGHFIEYIKHLINYANKYIADSIIDIVIPYQYNKHIITDEFKISSNINIHYLTEDDIENCNSKSNEVISSRKRCKVLRKYIKSLGSDNVLTLWATPYLFGLLDLLPSNIRFHSIEYIIPQWRSSPTFKNKITDTFKYFIFSTSKNIKSLYLLNDNFTPSTYNRQYHTSKFKFLPDPIEKIEFTEYQKRDSKKIVLLHAGSLKNEKGTFDIIECIKHLNPTVRNKFRLIICGKGATQTINEKVCNEIKNISSLIEIEFYNDFVDSDFFESLYDFCDFVLIPYHNSYQSSGNLGHAACYNKPVIGSNSGLLGELIKTYNLGITLKNTTASALEDILIELSQNNTVTVDGKNYVSRCSPQEFAKIIFNNMS